MPRVQSDLKNVETKDFPLRLMKRLGGITTHCGHHMFTKLICLNITKAIGARINADVI